MPITHAPRTRVHYIAAVAWLVFTVSLASWWLNVGLELTNRHTMFLWEGATFIVVLVGGGVAILVAIRREDRRRQALEMFFMSFTHDLKTSLASVQLQAEGLREDQADPATRLPLDRLLQDTVRLQIQLENSLFVAQPDGRLLKERIDVATAIDRQREDWPALAIDVHGSGVVLADARAFDTVLRNVLQNAVLHGEATHVDVRIERASGDLIRIVIEDGGKGISPQDLSQLGEPFVRPSATSGTGVGLHVSRRLVGRMGGAMRFSVSGGGLVVTIDLPEAR
ncbi:MAG: HAMP domain-containing histidine kinase [Acidobacteria bacterium]|nr:HAMP domain-containing histidine kinase [Acidobacteriota bacterium]